MPVSETTTTGSNRPGRMRGVLVLNGALLLALGAVTFSASVQANQGRGRGDYTMVSGGIPGIDSAAVYIIDAQNQEMVVLGYDHNTKLLQGIGYRHLGNDATALRNRNRPGN